MDEHWLTFGSSEPENAPSFPFQARYLGRLQDDISLRILYSAADVMVVPSKQENLSNAIMEALACGTPVVGFDIGGNKDMIEHRENGYLATPYEPDDLARGIEEVLRDKVLSFKWLRFREEEEGVVAKEEGKEPAEDLSFLSEMGRRAREKVVREFDSRVVAKRYVALYGEVLSGWVDR